MDIKGLWGGEGKRCCELRSHKQIPLAVFEEFEDCVSACVCVTSTLECHTGTEVLTSTKVRPNRRPEAASSPWRVVS